MCYIKKAIPQSATAKFKTIFNERDDEGIVPYNAQGSLRDTNSAGASPCPTKNNEWFVRIIVICATHKRVNETQIRQEQAPALQNMMNGSLELL